MTTVTMSPVFRAAGAFLTILVVAGIVAAHTSKGYNVCTSRRAKAAFWVGSLALLLFSALPFVPVYPGPLQKALLSSEVIVGFLVEEAWTFLGGLGCGVFLALVLTGNFSKRRDAGS